MDVAVAVSLIFLWVAGWTWCIVYAPKAVRGVLFQSPALLVPALLALLPLIAAVAWSVRRFRPPRQTTVHRTPPLIDPLVVDAFEKSQAAAQARAKVAERDAELRAAATTEEVQARRARREAEIRGRGGR